MAEPDKQSQMLTLSAVEHAFYIAGEAGGCVKALEKAALDLRGAAEHYRGVATDDQAAHVDAMVQPLESIAEQFDGQVLKGRAEIPKQIEAAVRIREQHRGWLERMRRAVQGAARGASMGWKGHHD
ncbi:MAG: hypothetical protein GY854_02380 [Deltaproteobacteria bacterium]|nr:hypothetical protein [Deltaproteobacteria bacterium]